MNAAANCEPPSDDEPGWHKLVAGLEHRSGSKQAMVKIHASRRDYFARGSGRI
jgi:hypothetical protein